MTESVESPGVGEDDQREAGGGESEEELTPVRFRGRIEGNYVGVPSRRLKSRSANATRYQMRIYRATIRHVEVLTEDPAEETSPQLPCFFQSEVEDVRIYGIRPRSCLEGSVYDIAVEEPQITHFASHGGKTYGRIVGIVYGRFLLPPPGDPLTIEMLETVEGYEEAIERERQVEGKDVADGAARRPRTGEPLHPPRDADEEEVSEEHEPPRLPLVPLAIAIAIAIGLTSGWMPCLIWLAFVIPVSFLRFMLHGMFRITDASRVVGAIVVLMHFGCVAALGIKWWTAGCKSEEPLYMIGIAATTLVSALLPSSLPLLGTGLGVAAVLWLWFGNVGARCDVQAPVAVDEPAPAKPSVKAPGSPRTNSDGTWPRRSTP